MADVAILKPMSSKRLSNILGSAVVQSILIVAICTLVLFEVGQYPIFGLNAAEQFTEDARIAVGAPPLAPDPNVMIVSITDDVLNQFPYREPVDRAFLANLLTHLAQKHVRAIGLDVLFDKPSEPAKDELLRRTIRNLPVPIRVSFVDDPRLIDLPDLPYLENFDPPDIRAMANVSTDKDGTVRGIFPGQLDRQGHYIPGLARGILERLGINTPPIKQILNYRRDTVEGAPAITDVSATEVAFLPESMLKGKIVLVGARFKIGDNHRTPFAVFDGDVEGDWPGVRIHANGLAQLLEGTNIHSLSVGWSVILIALMAAVGSGLGRISLPVWIQFGSGALIAATLFVIGFFVFRESAYMIPLVTPALAIFLSAWITDTVVGREFRKQRNFIQSAMGRFVSPKIVKDLVAHPDLLTLAASRREMTYLFTDIASFTTLAEFVGTDRLTGLINDYLTGLCAIILERDGTVCRFIGDAVFALWNAPSDQPDHRFRAVACALAIDEYSQNYSAAQRAKGVPFLHTRIGVNAGDAMVGYFGSPDRMEYTALGDAVNLSSRLESINKFFGTRICVSEPVVEGLPEIRFRPVASAIVKGKTLPMKIYEPWSRERLASGYADRYEAAYALLAAKDEGAEAAFDALAAEDPDDTVVHYHLGRLHKGERGIELHMDEK